MRKSIRGLTLLTKVKILVGFAQIVIKIETVYDVYLPAEVRAVIQKLRIVVSLGIEVRARDRLACPLRTCPSHIDCSMHRL